MPNRTNSIYNELNLVTVGTHQQITGTGANIILTAPTGACVLIFQPTNTTGNNCRIHFDGQFSTSGQGFRYDTSMGVQIYYLTYNQEINVFLSSGTTFDYQWARPVKGN